MKALLQKEFTLSLHPMAIVFLCFAALVFVPNYPYEVIFFFSGLSVYFICMTARENGDLLFTCSLPVTKRSVALARILTAVILQCALLIFTALCIGVKQIVYPRELLVNLAANSANLAFCGFGGLLLGTFNLVFFPLYYRDPNRVGIPFLIATAVQFGLIALMIILRHMPFYAPLTVPDPTGWGAKLTVLLCGLTLYAAMTFSAARLSLRTFERVDL